MNILYKVDRFINPIHLLGIRSYMRTKFFVYTFNITMIIMVLIILIGLAITSLETMSSTEIGKGLFITFLAVQFGIITLVFPAFSCTAIISEKEGKTFDLLISANLGAGEIVWGKFLSSFTNCFLFLIASLPIAMICFLFGGVTPSLIVTCYLLLSGYSAIIIMTGIALSSIYKSITRAIIASYLVVLIAAGFLCTMSFSLLYDYLYYSEFSRFLISIGGLFSVNGILTIFIVPIFLILSFIIFPFLIAKNSLYSYENKSSSSLRIYFLLFIVCSLAIFWTYYFHNISLTWPNGGIREDILFVNAFFFGTVGLICLSAAMGFGSENPVPEKFVMKRLNEYFKQKPLLSIFSKKPFIVFFTPGSYSGTKCVNALLFFCLSTQIILFYIVSDGFDSLSMQSSHFQSNIFYYTVVPALVVFSFVYFTSSFATFLSFRIQNRNWRRVVLMVLIIFLMLILPLYVLFEAEWTRSFQANIFNLQYLSPSLCYVVSWFSASQLEYTSYYTRYSYVLYNTIPIHHVHIIIYLVLAWFLQQSNKKKNRKIWQNLHVSEKAISDMRKNISEQEVKNTENTKQDKETETQNEQSS